MANLAKFLKTFGKGTKEAVEEMPKITAKAEKDLPKTISIKEVEDYFSKLPENQEPDQLMLDARDYYYRLTGSNKSPTMPMEEQAKKLLEFKKAQEAKQAAVTKEQYEKAVENARYEIPDPEDIVTKEDLARRAESAGESTNVMAAAGLPMAAKNDSEEGFLPKFKKKMSEAYDSTIKSAEDYVREQKNRKSWLNPNPEDRGKSLGISPEEYDQLIQDIGMSSPAMGTSKGMDKLIKLLGK